MIDRRDFLARVAAGMAAGSAFGHRPAPARAAGGAGLPPALQPPQQSHPHAELRLYTRPALLPRHRTVVERALQRRHEAHTSGWRGRDGKPVLAVGPVAEDVGFWHGDRLVKRIPRAWPFVAVLEYDGAGSPEAYLDWFRRPRHSASDDGWLLDPGVGYVQHINAETASAQDDRWCYFAVPDTPTGGHVGDSEFAIRARVRWRDGRTARLGWWLWFEAPRGRSEDDWHAEQIPLRDWRVLATRPKLGAVDVGPLDDPERQLAVHGEVRVFTFPPMPSGLVPGRGRT